MKFFVEKIKLYIFGFLNHGHERSVEAKKNIIASIGIKGISILVNLLLVSITINYINPTKYGVWLTVSSMVVWFSFFDIGLSQGLRNRFTEAYAAGDYEKAKKYISTTYAVLLIIFILLWLIFVSFNSFLDWSEILNTPSEISDELSNLVFIVFSFFCIQMVLKIINTILIADQKPALANFNSMLGQVLTLIIIIILTNTTEGSLIKLAYALSLPPTIVLIISSIVLFRGRYKKFYPSLNNVDLSYIKDIFRLGVKFFVIQISVIIIFQTSNIIITQVLGPEYVTTYNVSYKYFFILNMLFAIITTPFWSAFTEAHVNEEFQWMEKIVSNLEKLWYYSIPIVVVMFLISDVIYEIWVGDSVAISSSISFAMAIYVLAYNKLGLYNYLINGIGKIKIQLYLNLFLCILYVPIAYWLCLLKGVLGVVYANVIICIINVIFSQIQLKKLLNKQAFGIWNQ